MVRVGDKWAAVECIGTGKAESAVMARDADGKEYAASSELVNAFRLLCLCGNEFVVPVLKFRGKKVHRDCGCGRAGFTGENIVMTFSTQSGVKGHIQNLARMDGQSISYIVNTALRRYFEYRERGVGDITGVADDVQQATGGVQEDWNVDSKEVIRGTR